MYKKFFSQDVIRNNGIFLSGVWIYAFIGCGLLEYYGKDELHLKFNAYHSPFWDQFFKYYTDWSLPIMGAILLYIIIKNHTFKVLNFLALSFLVTSIIGIFVKRVFFIHVHRPTFYFQEKGIPLHVVEGVTSQIPYTYPSGHSANAFMLMMICSMLTQNKWNQILFFTLAVLVAFSRIYLSKHFVIDTIGGMVLGVSCTVMLYYTTRNWESPYLNQPIVPKK